MFNSVTDVRWLPNPTHMYLGFGGPASFIKYFSWIINALLLMIILVSQLLIYSVVTHRSGSYYQDSVQLPLLLPMSTCIYMALPDNIVVQAHLFGRGLPPSSLRPKNSAVICFHVHRLGKPWTRLLLAAMIVVDFVAIEFLAIDHGGYHFFARVGHSGALKLIFCSIHLIPHRRDLKTSIARMAAGV